MSIVVHAVYELDKSALEIGDRIRIITPDGNFDFACEHITWNDAVPSFELVLDNPDWNGSLQAEMQTSFQGRYSIRYRIKGPVRYGTQLTLGNTLSSTSGYRLYETDLTVIEVMRLTTRPELVSALVVTAPAVADVLM